jgi:CheY-like chemotaxis protein
MRLLLVEDEPGVARFVAKGLREQAYAVDTAADGDDALYKLSVNEYDAVIPDVMLPGRSGFEVCREMRASVSTGWIKHARVTERMAAAVPDSASLSRAGLQKLIKADSNSSAQINLEAPLPRRFQLTVDMNEG